MSRFSQFAASTPVGKVDQFLSGSSPNGYLPLNGSCASKTTYASLYAIVGDLDPPISDAITMCGGCMQGLQSCCGYNWCQSNFGVSSWGPTCFTRFVVNQGCQSGTNGGVYRLCYTTSDLQCGFLDACTCAPSCYCICVGSDAQIFSYHDNGTYYVGVFARNCGSAEHRTILWNFTCKCLVNVFRAIPSGDQSPPYPIDYSRVVFHCNGPYTRKFSWVTTPGVNCHCCQLCTTQFSDCFCNSMNSQMQMFCPCFGNGAVRYSKNYCCGKEPSSFISIGTSFCQGNYSSCFCCGILSWRFDTKQAKVDNACCYFSLGCCCPSSWGLPYGYSFIQRVTCWGSGPDCIDFYLTMIPYMYYGCGPAYSCCRFAFFSYTTAQTIRLQPASSGYPSVTCTQVGVPADVLVPSCGPVQTGGTTCLSGLSHLYYNEKSCKWWGRSVKWACAYCLPGTFCSSASCSTYDFCYCTGQAPVTYGATANCSPLASTDDPQKYTANTYPLNPGSSTCPTVLYGISTLGPSSNVFLLPSVTSAVTGLGYYIKT